MSMKQGEVLVLKKYVNTGMTYNAYVIHTRMVKRAMPRFANSSLYLLSSMSNFFDHESVLSLVPAKVVGMVESRRANASFSRSRASKVSKVMLH